ncbi:hypothetical protein TraAM80_06674 [Trypanosoma rangeli]|uniref:Transmembrane protein n=1 Tax=Trypanosoma rangeli TaxID=5698 RepID=A0A3R7KV85_TRYRA|nr:uncharacterized protein TraAM80_06674 [Trypanosoma rangeli]RNF02045.1 hypothetical protein TraAM80_06674 [Trypanosoma rangeli]|eukprot:RNF02045.1 hypothetical protein TraAM80_06674 [Trypanosoma rangeli]
MRRVYRVSRLAARAFPAQCFRHCLVEDGNKGDNCQESDSLNKVKEVDPFRVGYNMGMQSVHLEAIRMKLTDHLELFKSHFHALSDILKSNHDQVRQLHEQCNKAILHELNESNDQIFSQRSEFERHLKNLEDSLKSQIEDKVVGLQAHIDDRFENLRDVIKLGFGVLILLNLWMFYTISQNHRQYMNAHTTHTLNNLSSQTKK